MRGKTQNNRETKNLKDRISHGERAKQQPDDRKKKKKGPRKKSKKGVLN